MIQDTGGTCTKTWSAGPLVQNLDSRSLGRCPWFQCPRFWQVAFSAGDYRTGVGTPTQNPLTQTEIKRAAQRRLLDWSWTQQKREEPKRSSPETALPVLVTQPKGKTINPGSSPETARLVLVPTETGKTNSSSLETARPFLVTQPTGKIINP